jgi:inorganic pyrophosphatase
MSVFDVSAGVDLPDDCNVIIEIPALSLPVKYEMDKTTGLLQVDRFLFTSMQYPCNYGYIPQTLSGDGDPVDVLAITPVPLLSGALIRCRPLGMLQMEDEHGIDRKILAVPLDKLCPLYKSLRSHADLPPAQLDQIAHFFQHYKDLEPNKFVRVSGWLGIDDARNEIREAALNYRQSKNARGGGDA